MGNCISVTPSGSGMNSQSKYKEVLEYYMLSEAHYKVMISTGMLSEILKFLPIGILL